MILTAAWSPVVFFFAIQRCVTWGRDSCRDTDCSPCASRFPLLSVFLVRVTEVYVARRKDASSPALQRNGCNTWFQLRLFSLSVFVSLQRSLCWRTAAVQWPALSAALTHSRRWMQLGSQAWATSGSSLELASTQTAVPVCEYGPALEARAARRVSCPGQSCSQCRAACCRLEDCIQETPFWFSCGFCKNRC